ncbi:MAG: nucleotide exchange factor GrpE [Bacteroidota bacterium]
MTKKKTKDSKEKEVEEKIIEIKENTKSKEDKSSKKSDKKDKKKSKAEDFEQKYKDVNNKYMRLTAEFDNFRKRSLKEKMELVKSAGEDILINILPVMDNFERAMNSMDDESKEGAVKEGIEIIYNNFKEFLSQRGIKEIEAIGNNFDTDMHEAITKIPAPEEAQKGKVIDVIEKGYELHGKIIRFAKVVVGD